MTTKYFIALFLLANFYCKAQDNQESSAIKSKFFAEQKEFGTPIWKYLNNDFVAIHAQNQTNFTKKIDSLREIYNSHLFSYKGKLDKDIFDDEKVGIKYAFDRYLLNYTKYHKEITGEDLSISKANTIIINKNRDDFDRPHLLTNKDFASYVNDYIAMQADKMLATTAYNTMDNQQLKANWDVINSLFSNTEIRNYWRQKFLYAHIDNMGIKNIDKFYDSFINDCKNPEYLSKVQQAYNLDKKGRATHIIDTYKEIAGLELDMHIFMPDTAVYKGDRPTIVHFHGGSWSIGKPDWFFGTAEDYAKQGWVVAVVEYRIKGRQGTYPFEAVEDAKSSIRWLRKNASKYNIDPNKIIAMGNSSGGHLALATALVDKWNEKTDDITISPVPNIVIVNSAVYDLTVDNCKWIVENSADKDIVNEISPNSLIATNATKFLLIHGENDRNCEYSTAKYFYDQMKSLGNTIELHEIKEASHFIWYGKNFSEVANITKEYIDGLNWE